MLLKALVGRLCERVLHFFVSSIYVLQMGNMFVLIRKRDMKKFVGRLKLYNSVVIQM